MATANASAHAQRTAILASPLHELTDFYLAVDCLAPWCSGERTLAIAGLACFYGRQSTVGEILRRMRCSGDCGGRVGAAWLVSLHHGHRRNPMRPGSEVLAGWTRSARPSHLARRSPCPEAEGTHFGEGITGCVWNAGGEGHTGATVRRMLYESGHAARIRQRV